jgi:hypothetical protein
MGSKQSTKDGIEATTSILEQPEPSAREDRVDLVLRRTPRATLGGRRGVFSSDFPCLATNLFYPFPHHNRIYRKMPFIGIPGF